MLYYTQFVGDAVNTPRPSRLPPAFRAWPSWTRDPYDEPEACNFWVNQNNFFRQIRNFVIDLSGHARGTAARGIHWQVAQAT